MAAIVPFKVFFDQIKMIEKCISILLYSSTTLVIISLVIDTNFIDYKSVSNFLSQINCLFIILYFTLVVFSKCMFFEASSRRRFDFIDDSFNSSFSENKSVEYFTNTELTAGIYKLAVNCFESAIFSYHISKKMTNQVWVKNIIMIILFLIFAIWGYNTLIITLFHLSLPFVLIEQGIQHSIYVSRMKKINHDFRILFNDLKGRSNLTNKYAEIIINILNYETALASTPIILDDNIYNKLNPELSEKWNQMKINYSISD